MEKTKFFLKIWIIKTLIVCIQILNRRVLLKNYLFICNIIDHKLQLIVVYNSGYHKHSDMPNIIISNNISTWYIKNYNMYYVYKSKNYKFVTYVSA